MLRISSYINAVEMGKLDTVLAELYGEKDIPLQKQRYLFLLRRMEKWAGDDLTLMVSAPGRTELGGNHTDHNKGVVLAAGVSFDCLAVAMPTGGNVVRVRSEGFPDVIEVDLTELEPREGEEGTPAALIRGVADGFVQAGYTIEGFDACISGEVPVGAGLSSSAAFEVCIGRIFNELFNDGTVSRVELARIGRRAENLHFGKPCGFMDQLACAVQGVLSIDFKDEQNPKVTEVDVDFESFGYQLCVVDTGGDHADLTPEYAAIPEEMCSAARVLGQETARGLTMELVLEKAAEIRRLAGGRGLLRLIHFIEESERAQLQADVLRHGDIHKFLRLVNASGDSSWKLLQNCISLKHANEQPITVALTLTERFLEGRGAWRIQGGGFAGTIQAYVPSEMFESYTAYMETVFGSGSVVPLRIRKSGNEVILPKGTEA
ncbi:galactokinase family protein [Pseudodesulfovibrio sp. zrk46]|uniref:galactokinase n=1 Tax=Pseudodesulfovibrio sp. zrk46 TaxID=2725288 RepID=UPI001448CA0C|nr:galactokinase family protein [Pseudodesulfovibrio sp. zrk46]QJB55351.1 galactokinase [Pseudodesulfovibrio sp. zrk46]